MMTRFFGKCSLALGLMMMLGSSHTESVLAQTNDPMVFQNGVDESTDFCVTALFSPGLVHPMADDVTLPNTTQISAIEWSGRYVDGLPVEHQFNITILRAESEIGPFVELAEIFVRENDLNINQLEPGRFVFSTNIDFTMEANETYWVSIWSVNNLTPQFCWGSTTPEQNTGNARWDLSINFANAFLPLENSVLGQPFALHLTLFGTAPDQDQVFENVDSDIVPDFLLPATLPQLGGDNVEFSTTTRIQQVHWSGAYTNDMNMNLPGPASDSFDITIYRDLGNSGLAVEEVFSDVQFSRQLRPVAPPSFSYNYNFSADIEFTMEANTTYWITIAQSGSNSLDFNWFTNFGDGLALTSDDSGTSFSPLNAELYLELSGRENLLYNNGPDGSEGDCTSSDPTPGFALGNVVADNVFLLNRSRIQQIQWYGSYQAGFAPSTDNFVIDLYLDDNGQPGERILSAPIGNNVQRRPLGGDLGNFFEYTADIVFNLAANTEYWISIHNSVFSSNTTGGFCWGSSNDPNGNALQSSDGGTTWNSPVNSPEMTLFLYGDPLPNETIVFDSGTGINNADTHGFSDAITNSGPIAVADEVQVPVDTAVNQITWSGTYFSFFFPPIGFVPAPSIDDFTISIHADAGGQPAADPIVTFNVGNSVSRQQVPGPFTFTYIYTAEIDFVMEANTTYWVSIYENIASPAFASFCWSAQGGIGNSHFSNNGQAWQPGGSRFSILLLNTVPQLSGFFEPNGFDFSDSTTSNLVSSEVKFYQFDFDGQASSLTFDTFGSNFDTEIGLYNSGGVLLAENNDAENGDLQSELILNRLPAGTYYLAVGGADTVFNPSGFDVEPGSEGGNLNLRVTTGSDPVFNVVGTFTVDGADYCDSDTQTLNNDSPYFYEVIYDGVFPILIETLGSPNDIDTEIALFDFDGNLLAENDNVLGNGSQLVFDFNGLSAGTYYVAVAGSDSEFADGFVVNQLSADFTPGPVTVKVATRQAIPAVAGAFSATDYQFSDSDTVMLDPDGYVIYDLFYDGVAPLTIDTLASPDDVNTEIALYGTGPGRPLVAENDDAEGTNQSKLFFDSLPAGNYNIVVSGHETQFFDNLFIYNVFTDFTPGQATLSVSTDAMFILGDVNCDGVVNLLDIEPFVDLISNVTFDAKADINQDGVVNLLDVEPFIALVSGG